MSLYFHVKYKEKMTTISTLCNYKTTCYPNEDDKDAFLYASFMSYDSIEFFQSHEGGLVKTHLRLLNDSVHDLEEGRYLWKIQLPPYYIMRGKFSGDIVNFVEYHNEFRSSIRDQRNVKLRYKTDVVN